MLLVALALLASLPAWIGNSYYVNIASQVLLYAVFALGLNVLVGYAGLVSLGHAGLFGVGAYTAGVLVMKLAAPLWITLPAAVLVTAGFGALLALPALRVSGPYLAMVTLAFGTIIQILINGGHGHFLSIVGALAVTLGAAALFAVLALRGTGLGFVMITVALGQIVWGVAYRWISLTNGDNGVSITSRPACW